MNLRSAKILISFNLAIFLKIKSWNSFPLFFITLLSLVISPAFGQQKHLYIANDDHTDYIWTADAETYRVAFINQLDYYINLMETKNASLSTPFQHRYNCDNSLWVYEYEKAKSTVDFQRLITQIKSDHISVPFNTLIPLYGGQNTEIAIRGMYYAGHLERKYGIDIDLVATMENQTMPLGINSLWAGAGAKYSWKGICNCKCPDLTSQNRKYNIYNSNGIDGKGVLMKWYDYISLVELGGYAEIVNPALAISQLSDKCNTTKYPYTVAAAFGYGWDGLESYIDNLPALAQTESNASQQVFVSNEKDFFADFQSKYSNSIPSQAVSFGNDWDVLIATMAKVSGDIKRSTEKLRTAEALASLVALQDTGFAQNLASQRELAWISLGKYFDHDWTSDSPASIGRPQFQKDMESNFSGYVNTLYNSAKTALGNQIIKNGTNTRFYVFNQLSWNRNDAADFPYSGNLPVKVIDITTKSEVPSQVISLNGVQYIRIFASNVPSVGYKVYEIQAGISATAPVAATFTNGIFENGFYRLSLSHNGSITSFQDKSDGLYEYTGSAALNDFGTGNLTSGTYTVENPGPVSVTVNCSSNSPYTHISRFTLYKSVERVDIENQINYDIGDTTIVYQFPFNLSNSTVWHEEVGAVINAKLESNGGHYSDQNARFDWLTANHFVHVGNPLRGITVSNLGAHFFKLGNSSTYVLDENSSSIQFLAAGNVAFATLGIKKQAGNQTFQYQFALQPKSGSFNQTSSMKMALEHQNPLTTGIVSGGNIYPESTFSLINISPENDLLWSLKPAEEGAAKGLIARVWNQSQNSSMVLGGSYQLLSAKNTSHVETDLSDAKIVNNKLTESIGYQELRTFRMFFNPTFIVTDSEVSSALKTEFKVYPNPVSSVLNISGNHLPNDTYNISLSNILGQTVIKDELIVGDNKFDSQIDLKDLKSGVFSLTIASGKTKDVFKIIKK